MRIIKAEKLTQKIKELYLKASFNLPEDVKTALSQAIEREPFVPAQEILKLLLENAKIAAQERIPLCQDTGFPVVFIDWGQEVLLEEGDLESAVNLGLQQASEEGYLRRSILKHPLNRFNTGTNTPGVIHCNLVPGNKIKITIAPKGGGSENMSQVKMLKPADGEAGVINSVVRAVTEAKANPCPPLIIGVGLGGTIEKAAFLAKKAVLRPLNLKAAKEDDALLEDKLLAAVNATGIGPQGLGGYTTALGVKVESYPCHLATLPVAINLLCHSARHSEVEF